MEFGFKIIKKDFGRIWQCRTYFPDIDVEGEIYAMEVPILLSIESLLKYPKSEVYEKEKMKQEGTNLAWHLFKKKQLSKEDMVLNIDHFYPMGKNPNPNHEGQKRGTKALETLLGTIVEPQQKLIRFRSVSGNRMESLLSGQGFKEFQRDYYRVH